jgi:hypothetical protein
MVEPQSSKLITRVRFSSPAPAMKAQVRDVGPVPGPSSCSRYSAATCDWRAITDAGRSDPCQTSRSQRKAGGALGDAPVPTADGMALGAAAWMRSSVAAERRRQARFEMPFARARPWWIGLSASSLGFTGADGSNTRPILASQRRIRPCRGDCSWNGSRFVMHTSVLSGRKNDGQLSGRRWRQTPLGHLITQRSAGPSTATRGVARSDHEGPGQGKFLRPEPSA